MATDIGNRIISLRTDRGWSQGQLAYQSGVKQTWLSNVETGRTAKPEPDLLVKVARALGTTVEYLVTGTGTDIEDPAVRSLAQRLVGLPPSMRRALDDFAVALGAWSEGLKEDSREAKSSEESQKHEQ